MQIRTTDATHHLACHSIMGVLGRDRRSVIITLTDKYRELLKQYIPLARGIVDHIMSSISKEENIRLIQGGYMSKNSVNPN